MATKKPTSANTHLFPAPGHHGCGSAYILWWLSSRIDFSGECWVWAGAKSARGYGVISLKSQEFPQKVAMSHRAVYEICVEPIPDGMRVLHRCDNPPCCRPSHLFLGTDADNVKDKVAKGRQARGEGSGTSRLTALQVLEIRKRFLACERPQKIAESFNIAECHVYSIATGRSWSHLPLSYTGSMRKRTCVNCGQKFPTMRGVFYDHVDDCSSCQK